MVTIEEFENWQNSFEKELGIEEINLVSDMMAMEDDLYSKIVCVVDGFGLTKTGNIVYSNRDLIKYEKVLRGMPIPVQEKKVSHLKLIK